ncbi:hypothetical protein DL93DRAFT_2081378 [Clavulina sp. PMI_390]|nr:hypothetical protein DL93DRAFT_2081378 [Clavulina sp. PMI_390]
MSCSSPLILLTSLPPPNSTQYPGLSNACMPNCSFDRSGYVSSGAKSPKLPSSLSRQVHLLTFYGFRSLGPRSTTCV